MTASGNIRDRDAVVTEVPGSRVVYTAVHHGAELELDPLRHTEPMKLLAHRHIKPLYSSPHIK